MLEDFDRCYRAMPANSPIVWCAGSSVPTIPNSDHCVNSSEAVVNLLARPSRSRRTAG